MEDWWIYALVALGVIVLLSWVVGALSLFAYLIGMVCEVFTGQAYGQRHTHSQGLEQDADDDVECPCCGLSPLESVRSTTGEDACVCCGRRPYRVKSRRRRGGGRFKDEGVL